MANTGRTLNKYSRVYIGGYDMSGYARSIGPLAWTYAEGNDDPQNSDLVGVWPGQGTISPGTLNAIFDNTAASGIHAVLGSAGVMRNILVAQGIRAIPAMGDPAFMCQARQDDYLATPEQTPVALTVKFGPTSNGATLTYCQPWGVLLHAYGAETGASTAAGVDLGAATSKGGYMMYHVFAASGAGHTANLKVQDSVDQQNANFGDLLTTGVIDVGTAPISGVVALAVTANVKQYVRFQIALGTATSVTFALAFALGN